MKWTVGLIGIVALVACDTGTKIDSQKVAEEMRSRKVIHVNQAQITETAFREGNRLASWLDAKLITHLKEIQQNNLAQWGAQCNIKSLSVNSIQKSQSASIQRIALRGNAKQKKLDGVAAQIWDAYRYNAEKNLPMEPNVQQVGEAGVLYSNAIILSEAICLKCHGKLGKDLTVADFNALKTISPVMDSLVNYQLNQPIGIWNILLDKGKLIQQTNAK